MSVTIKKNFRSRLGLTGLAELKNAAQYNYASKNKWLL
jgi:hypothetical protein